MYSDLADLEIQNFLMDCRREPLEIDRAAEVMWDYRYVCDPYDVRKNGTEEQEQIGRDYFARRPGSDSWV